jgi:hypothetical protein
VGAGKAIERIRRRAETNGEKGLFLGVFANTVAEAKLAGELGFDHSTNYNITNRWNATPGKALVDYREVMDCHARTWQSFADTGMPYWPTVTHGWDVSARNHPYEPWPPTRWQWPWGHIITGNTPERFGQLVHAARRFMSTQENKSKVMVLNAWNEWTEGSMLAPTKDEGYGVLKALKAALK